MGNMRPYKIFHSYMCFRIILFAGNQLLVLLGNQNILLSEHSTIAFTFTSAHSLFYTNHI